MFTLRSIYTCNLIGTVLIAQLILQEPPPTAPMNKDYIRKESKIYGKNSARSLSKYEEQINHASAQLCIRNPDLLHDRAYLLKECRKILDDEGYAYKKGKSRSRELNLVPDLAQCIPKLKKINQDIRLSRITELQERVKDITEQLSYKEKRRENASVMHNYKDCDLISEQMSELKSERRKLNIELTNLTRRQKKSKWYHGKKLARKDSAQSTLDFSPSSSSSTDHRHVSSSPVPNTSSSNSSHDISLMSDSDGESDPDTVILSSDESNVFTTNTRYTPSCPRLLRQSRMVTETTDEVTDHF